MLLIDHLSFHLSTFVVQSFKSNYEAYETYVRFKSYTIGASPAVVYQVTIFYIYVSFSIFYVIEFFDSIL